MSANMETRGLCISVLLALIGTSTVIAAKVASYIETRTYLKDAEMPFDYMTASYAGDCPSNADDAGYGSGTALISARGPLFLRERQTESSGIPQLITRAWIYFNLSTLSTSTIDSAKMYLHQYHRLNTASANSAMYIGRATVDVSGTCPSIAWNVSGVTDALEFGTNGDATSKNVSIWHTAAMTDWVKGWVDGSSSNYGVWIYLVEHHNAGAYFDELSLEINGVNVTSTSLPATTSTTTATTTTTTQASTTTATTTTTPQASANPSAVGDPHLINLRGDKFDVHDGMHRLVHYPRGAPEDEALLLVDAQAVDLGYEANCYSVYFQRMKFFGGWVGREIVIDTDAKSLAGFSPSAFSMSFADEHMDWPSVAKQHDVYLKLNGSMPVTATASTRKASTDDAMGGEQISFKIGEERPVLLQVWSSHGSNQLTHGKEVRYLNLEVQNLPRNSGGILGVDVYSRPSTSHCGLVQDEKNLLSYIDQNLTTFSLMQLWRPKWTAFATAQQ